MWIDVFVEKPRELYKTILDLPPAAKFILYVLDVKKILPRKAFEKETLLPKRTIVSALQVLVKEGIIEKIEGDQLKSLDCNYRKRIDYREVYYKVKIL